MESPLLKVFKKHLDVLLGTWFSGEDSSVRLMVELEALNSFLAIMIL